MNDEPYYILSADEEKKQREERRRGSWRDFPRSQNIEDRRGEGIVGKAIDWARAALNRPVIDPDVIEYAQRARTMLFGGPSQQEMAQGMQDLSGKSRQLGAGAGTRLLDVHDTRLPDIPSSALTYRQPYERYNNPFTPALSKTTPPPPSTIEYAAPYEQYAGMERTEMDPEAQHDLARSADEAFKRPREMGAAEAPAIERTADGRRIIRVPIE